MLQLFPACYRSPRGRQRPRPSRGGQRELFPPQQPLPVRPCASCFTRKIENGEIFYSWKLPVFQSKLPVSSIFNHCYYSPFLRRAINSEESLLLIAPVARLSGSVLPSFSPSSFPRSFVLPYIFSFSLLISFALVRRCRRRRRRGARGGGTRRALALLSLS